MGSVNLIIHFETIKGSQYADLSAPEPQQELEVAIRKVGAALGSKAVEMI